MEAMPTAHLHIRQQAPLNSWVAISNDETRIVAVGNSLKALKQKLAESAEADYFISKTPPLWRLSRSSQMRVRLPHRSIRDSSGSSYSFCRVECAWRKKKHGRSGMTALRRWLIPVPGGVCSPSNFGEEIGLHLKAGTPDMPIGISGAQEIWLHDVLLDLPGGPVRVRAAFQENLPLSGILGMQGLFEHFAVTFDPLARECQLDRSYRT